jgi:hypothetical protein
MIVSLEEVYDFCKIDRDRTQDEAIMESARVAAEAMVRNTTHRTFEKRTAATARKFMAVNPFTVWVDDFWTLTDLVVKTDDDGDGTFETTWAAGDYELHPLNGILAGVDAPYFRVEAVANRCFPIYKDRPAAVQVTAQWGWDEIPEPVRFATLILAAANERVRDLVRGDGGFTRWSREDAMEMLRPYIHPAHGLGIA